MQLMIDVYAIPEQHERQQAIEAVLRRAGYEVRPLILENRRDGRHYQQRRAIAPKRAA